MLNIRSISARLTLVTITTISVALTIAFVATILSERTLLRNKITEDLSILASIIGNNSSAALIFDDESAGQLILGSLRAESDVTYASLHTLAGDQLAHYQRDDQNTTKDIQEEFENSNSINKSLEITQSIELDGEIIGKIYIRSDLGKLDALFWETIKTILMILLGTLFITLLVISRLQYSVTQPITRLAETARRICTQKDFSLRAVKESNDEVGVLADGFNEMLTQIQVREAELRENEKHLAEAQRIGSLGHWTWDFSNDVVRYSDQIEVIFGAEISNQLSMSEVLLRFIHPEDNARVNDIVNSALERKKGFEVEYKIIRPGKNEERILHQAAKVVLDNDGNGMRMIGTIQDITDLQNAEEHRFLAYYDSVTSLPNRAYLREHIEKALINAQRNDSTMAILFVDLDHFKRVNDNFGHSAGDELLKAVGHRLKTCLRDTDVISQEPHSTLLTSTTMTEGNTLARFGGDEFVIVVTDLNTIEEAKDIPQRIITSLSQSFTIQDHEIHIGASIGISIYPTHGKDMETLLMHADVAMYKSKEQGRQNYSFYTESMKDNMYKSYSLEQDLRKAVEQEELALHYQPKFNLKTEQITGVEALIRWHHPTNGLISPAEFIPLAEESGLILTIGEWVLRTACAQAKAWQRTGLSSLCVAVNVSAKQLKENRFSDMVDKILRDTGLDPQYLELEITEGILVEDTETSSQLLTNLKNIGVKISLDDFGTGYSSLSYLNRFPFDSLKIDRSFVKNITHDDENSALTAGIIALSHSLNLLVVAEGVETREQLEFMRKHECDEIQGYYYSLPLSVDDFSEQYCQQPNSVTQLHSVQK